ncbi:hypothetical protein [Pseudomonas sp. NFACC15-1]|uniref:hypothetical protein n=1 Tax=Pseudomonas sp. NFACC15-1 TaxID=1566243 RepID=UPI00147C3860|nr:hypothetical protein [Pseudomonas sp. NFACC15-1]
MSPRKNTRPNVPTSPPDTPHGSRDTTPESLPRSPIRVDGNDSSPGSSPGRQTEAADAQATVVQVAELTSQAAIAHVPASLSLDNYYLSPELIPMLSDPDPTSGIQTFRTRTYVKLAEGGTVLLGRDADQNYRARSSAELVASGPRLEQVEGSLLWRQVSHGSDSTLTITRYNVPDDDPRKGPRPSASARRHPPVKSQWKPPRFFARNGGSSQSSPCRPSSPSATFTISG